MAGSIFDTDESGAPGRVGKCNDGAQKPFRRGEVALELQVLALGPA